MHYILLWRTINSLSAVHDQIKKVKKAKPLAFALHTDIVAVLHCCFVVLPGPADEDSAYVLTKSHLNSDLTVLIHAALGERSHEK